MVVASTTLISIPRALALPNMIEVSQNPVDIEKADKDADGAIDLPANVPDFQLNPVAEGIEVSPASELQQVTSVSQLRDVLPTDWAFEALQSLIERYGCIAGYPDGSFRGNRALSRYEFAAGLNACFSRIREVLTTTTGDSVNQEDLESIKKLEENFAVELVSLRDSVDTLARQTVKLEQQQFSTTTTLFATSLFHLTGAFTGGNVKFESLPGLGGSVPPATPNGDIRYGGRDGAGNPLIQETDEAQPTLSFRTILRLRTSFTGKDLLLTRIVASNSISPINQFVSGNFLTTYGNPVSEVSFGGAAIGSPDVVIPAIFYQFPASDSVRITVGPRIDWFWTFDLNRFSDYLSGGTTSIDSSNNTLVNAVYFGPGAIAEWQINKKLQLAAGYLGNSFRGLFNGTNSTTAELTFTPTDTFALRLLYTYAHLDTFGGQGVFKPLPFGFADAGPGFSVFDPTTGKVSNGGLKPHFAHTIGVNFDWLITSKFGVFGRYGYGTTTLKPIDKVISTQTFQVGAAFPDLGKEGAMGVVTFVMPMDILSGRKYFAAGGGDGGKIYELEFSYFYPITDRMAVVPTFYTIFNPNNFDSNPNIYVTHLRVQFNF